MTAKRYTAADVRAALLNRHRAPEWACFFEVADGTGARATRSADAIAMSLYSSRGLRLHGFEIKVSRSDWLHELKQPDKSVAIQRYCDHWWVVTPADIIKDGELPPTWGHLILKGNGLHCATKAPVLDRAAWEPEFLAALLRRAHDAREKAIRDGVDAAMASERDAIEAEVAKRVSRELSIRSSRHDEAVKQLAAIREAAGIEPDRYFDGEGFGRAIGLVHRAGVTATYGSLDTLAHQARRLAEAVEAVRAESAGAVRHD
ncbi:hypothetical protein BRX36_19440 [Sphingomonas sp. S-NIH.Pt1_0416]|uniref:hypothetical protein n=1 Tax=Sphingomonas sp. S-NIH.Pt1_0416 TaxID=1920123 RepID=UPI000F7EF327|nr:hypothetical protein [Sphingomonas sp. S-NIH.Pt1_0416]RSU59145.1 hypothetical protein BRX36_19440 [Sphingomonas sp. S-NIH.Pt1_0416]